MASLEGFFGPRDSRELFERVSQLPPEDLLSYLLSTSKRILAVYAELRDSLPRGYGRLKFSHFVDVKEKQVENLLKVALNMYPGTFSSEVSGEKVKVSISQVGDYLNVLRKAIELEELQLRALRYLEERIDNPEIRAILGDIAGDVEENVLHLRKELERVERFDRKAKFSDFIKELVGDRNGRV